MADDQSRPPENDKQDAEQPADSPTERRDERSEDEDAVAEENEETVGETDGETITERSETAAETDEAVAEAEEGAEADGADAPEERGTVENDAEDDSAEENAADVPSDVRKYERFKKVDGAQYDRVNEFLRDRTYITAREWAIARLCADFRTETGVEMTKIGENLPELVPFMTDTYTPQAVNQARSSFEGKVRQAGATFLYGAMSGFFTAEELDDMMYEVTEVAKFLLEVEGVDLSVEEELEAEDRISGVMRDVRSASEELRHDELECPHCGHEMEASEADTVDTAEGDD
jgi:hypothetical protein